ncbi:MAG: adenylate/guanylate cyclase domain-containing protein [Acidimicrobiia bacterium]
MYQRHRGGAEVELSLLFADVRGSTALAEGISPAEFGELLNRFYEISSRVIDEEGGMVDKYLGDGVFALFIPGFTGPDHARRAITAGRRLLAASREAGAEDTRIPVGVGVHSGTAFTGVVGGTPEMLDFTAVGDAVNVAARLGSMAAPGQLLVSADTVTSAEIDPAGFDQRRLRLEGRQEEIDTFVVT